MKKLLILCVLALSSFTASAAISEKVFGNQKTSAIGWDSALISGGAGVSFWDNGGIPGWSLRLFTDAVLPYRQCGTVKSTYAIWPKRLATLDTVKFIQRGIPPGTVVHFNYQARGTWYNHTTRANTNGVAAWTSPSIGISDGTLLIQFKVDPPTTIPTLCVQRKPEVIYGVLPL